MSTGSEGLGKPLELPRGSEAVLLPPGPEGSETPHELPCGAGLRQTECAKDGLVLRRGWSNPSS